MKVRDSDQHLFELGCIRGTFKKYIMDKVKMAVLIIANIMLIGVISAQSGPIASGGSTISSNGSISSSIGQIDFFPFVNTIGSLNPGNQQPSEILEIVSIHPHSLDVEIKVFPNPIIEQLNIKIDPLYVDELSARIYSIDGKLIYSSLLSGIEHFIPFNNWSSGTFLLIVSDLNSNSQTFKIVKL